MYCACRVLASGDLMPSGVWKVKPTCQVTKLLYMPGLRVQAGGLVCSLAMTGFKCLERRPRS